MLYAFGKNTEKELFMDMDGRELIFRLREIYGIRDRAKLQAKLKVIIKRKNDFYSLCDSINITKQEMFVLLNSIFPDLFCNKRTLSSLSKLYKDEKPRPFRQPSTKTSKKKR